AGWKASENERSIFVQTFDLPGNFTDSVVLMCEAVEREISLGLLKHPLLPGELRARIPGSAVYRTGRSTVIGGQMASTIEYDDIVSRKNGPVNLRIIQFAFLHGSTLVTLAGTLKAESAAQAAQLPAHMDEMRPIFRAMADSIVVHGGESATAITTTQAAPLPAATAPPPVAFPWPTLQFLLIPGLVGGGICFAMFSSTFRARDKKSPHGRCRVGRLAFFGWGCCLFLIAAVQGVFICGIISAPSYPVGAMLTGGMLWIAMPALTIRRLEDIGWSPWLAASGILVALFYLSYWQPLTYIALGISLTTLSLCFIPGRPLQQAGADASTPDSKDQPQRPRLLHPQAVATTSVSIPESQAIAPPPMEDTAPATPPALITLLQGGETYGPFPTHEIIQLWETGQIAGNASYWRAGMPDYRPLAPDIEHLRDMAGTGIS
ncbi:MAG TPA: GYF domain-containing protein, partial [Prosthecobacter sp.]